VTGHCDLNNLTLVLFT